MISVHDDIALESLRRRCRLDPAAVRRFRAALLKKGQSAEASLGKIPEPHRSLFENEVRIHTLTLQSRHDSALDGATKLLFRTAAGQLIESVILRIGTGRTSLCVSSQVGCAVKCGFCATGQMGLIADLRAEEILDQVVQANQLLAGEECRLSLRERNALSRSERRLSTPRRIRNVVFMGMGEPLMNEAAVTAAVMSLTSSTHFGLSPSRVLVSTIGIPAALTRFARRFPDVGLALSLHAARQETRERIIPLAKKYPLDALKAAILETTAIQSRPLMIEYVLLDGVNDADEDAAVLIDYLANVPVHVNLIPYNAIDAGGFVGTLDDRRRQFGDRLKAAGLKVTIRYSLGADIAAACGQLVQRQERQKASETKVSMTSCGER
jgi:23S rRNA (adenine2503-C2)-methyltransferase